MTLPFSADEVLGLAEQIERNGAAFYRRAAGIAGDPPRKMLLELAEMEDGHEKTFARMRAEFAKKGGARAFDPDGDAELYLRAMAAGRVFDATSDPAAALTGKETVVQILQQAVALEKDSIVFYVGIRRAVGERGGRERWTRSSPRRCST
jgi:rubrerythrin